jgi:hypothetical protein
MEEIWKDIPGYEGLYQVSSFGNVRSLNYRRTGKKQILKQRINDKGYYRIDLFKNNIKKQYGAHQLVMMAFENHTPNGVGIVVNHKDNNPLNNHKDNLEIVSTRYNNTCHKVNYKNNRKFKNNRFELYFYIKNKYIFLGVYDTNDECDNILKLAIKNIDKYNGNTDEFRMLLNPKLKNKYDLKYLYFRDGKYQVVINSNGCKITLGDYELEKATQVRQVALDNKHLFDGDKTKFRELVLTNL